MCHLCYNSLADVLANLQRTQSLLPTSVGIEDRHIENEHRIMSSLSRLENALPAAGSFRFWFHLRFSDKEG
jgi:hypothetical protein